MLLPGSTKKNVPVTMMLKREGNGGKKGKSVRRLRKGEQGKKRSTKRGLACRSSPWKRRGRRNNATRKKKKKVFLLRLAGKGRKSLREQSTRFGPKGRDFAVEKKRRSPQSTKGKRDIGPIFKKREGWRIFKRQPRKLGRKAVRKEKKGAKIAEKKCHSRRPMPQIRSELEPRRKAGKLFPATVEKSRARRAARPLPESKRGRAKRVPGRSSQKSGSCTEIIRENALREKERFVDQHGGKAPPAATRNSSGEEGDRLVKKTTQKSLPSFRKKKSGQLAGGLEQPASGKNIQKTAPITSATKRKKSATGELPAAGGKKSWLRGTLSVTKAGARGPPLWK